MTRRTPRSTQRRSSAASDVYKRQTPNAQTRSLLVLVVLDCFQKFRNSDHHQATAKTDVHAECLGMIFQPRHSLFARSVEHWHHLGVENRIKVQCRHLPESPRPT